MNVLNLVYILNSNFDIKYGMYTVIHVYYVAENLMRQLQDPVRVNSNKRHSIKTVTSAN